MRDTLTHLAKGPCPSAQPVLTGDRVMILRRTPRSRYLVQYWPQGRFSSFDVVCPVRLLE